MDILTKGTTYAKTKNEKDLGIFEEDRFSDMNWLGYGICKDVVNQLLGILATGRFSLKLAFQPAY